MTRRRALFEIGGDLYADLLYNWGEPLKVDANDLAQLLHSVPRDQLVIGRRLSAAEARRVAVALGDAEVEQFAFLYPEDAARWRRR